MEGLIKLLKHIEKHPKQDFDTIFSLDEFSESYKDFVDCKCKKHLICPACEKDAMLTKHHIIPRGKGGKGMLENYCYLCRDCHDEVHDMKSVFDKIRAFIEYNPEANIPAIVNELNVRREHVIEVVNPEYYKECRIRYDMRISRKIGSALTNLFN